MKKFTKLTTGAEGDNLAEFLKVRNGDYLFYKKTLTSVPLFDTSNVTNMSYMFYSCSKLTSVPQFDTSKVKNMERMFHNCTKLTSVPLFDTSNVTNMSSVFIGCSSLTNVPLFDTSKVTDMKGAFYSCEVLTEIPALDMRNVTDFSEAFWSCDAVTDIRIRNIKANLTVGSGTLTNSTSYGQLLTVDSLVHLIYELRKQSYSRTLTVGTTNLAKLADVYVKAVEITDEMRAEDDLIDEKYPFVRCDSTDEGAMLITTYASTIKNWAVR